MAIPEALLRDKAGECIRRTLEKLGAEVVPAAIAALSRLRGQGGVLVLPLLGSVRTGREELYGVMPRGKHWG